ncbi:MAG TPA: hypothetical protein VFS62_01655 [Chloroflexota bacterium]|nr:hypothetical protein [Chloroflexota bacterium]
MRLGINIPLKDASGEVLDASGVAKRAQMLEAVGIEGAWLGDSLGGSLTRPDDLLVWKTDHTQQRSIYEHDYTDEQLAQIRALIPRDGRKPYADRKAGPRP